MISTELVLIEIGQSDDNLLTIAFTALLTIDSVPSPNRDSQSEADF